MIFNRIKFLFVFLVFVFTRVSAQYAVITQYQSIPLATNPANAGNFSAGKYRAGVSFSHLTNGEPNLNDYEAITNNFYNLGFDYKIGNQKKFALGFNYMQISSPRNMFRQEYYSLLFSKEFNFNKEKNYSLFLGAQTVYADATVDESKGGYSVLIDARGFEYFRPSNAIGNKIFSKKYLNVNLGAIFNVNFESLKYKSGISIQNINRPVFGMMYGRNTKKRVAINFQSELNFNLNNKYTIQFTHFTYKEGIFVRGAPVKYDSSDVNETIYGISIKKTSKITHSISFMTRTVKTVILKGAIELYRGLNATISYELPFQHKYYPVSQYGISLVYEPVVVKFKKKNKEKLNS